MRKCSLRDNTLSVFSAFNKCYAIVFIVSVYALSAYAAECREMICGDYRYTPLQGYVTQDSLIQNNSSFIVLNPMKIDNRTQEDIDIPTIYCLTEKNDTNFDSQLSQKDEILIRTLAKQESIVKLAQDKCRKLYKGSIYFPVYISQSQNGKDEVYYDFVIIEMNDPGNHYSSLLVINPGRLDRDIETWPPKREEKRERMCARAYALLDTIKKQ